MRIISLLKLQCFIESQFDSVHRDTVHIHLRPASRHARRQTGAVLQEAPEFHVERAERSEPRHRRMQIPIPHAALELFDPGREPPITDHRPITAGHASQEDVEKETRYTPTYTRHLFLSLISLLCYFVFTGFN